MDIPNDKIQFIDICHSTYSQFSLVVFAKQFTCPRILYFIINLKIGIREVKYFAQGHSQSVTGWIKTQVPEHHVICLSSAIQHPNGLKRSLKSHHKHHKNDKLQCYKKDSFKQLTQ